MLAVILDMERGSAARSRVATALSTPPATGIGMLSSSIGPVVSGASIRRSCGSCWCSAVRYSIGRSSGWLAEAEREQDGNGWPRSPI